MTFRSLSALALTSTVLSSCIYYTDPVPDIPYARYGAAVATPVIATAVQTPDAAYATAIQYESSWYTTQPSVLPTATPYSSAPSPYANSPYSSASQPPPLTPMPAATAASIPPPAKQSSAITQPQLKLNPITPKPAEATKPAKTTAAKPAAKAPNPAPKPAAAASKAKDPKSITNTGPIPVATPVPGDPTRVYNPLDSSKTIRITDKNGKVYPSGKELKVRGTNFHFYVP